MYEIESDDRQFYGAVIQFNRRRARRDGEINCLGEARAVNEAGNGHRMQQIFLRPKLVGRESHLDSYLHPIFVILSSGQEVRRAGAARRDACS